MHRTHQHHRSTFSTACASHDPGLPRASFLVRPRSRRCKRKASPHGQVPGEGLRVRIPSSARKRKRKDKVEREGSQRNRLKEGERRRRRVSLGWPIRTKLGTEICKSVRGKWGRGGVKQGNAKARGEGGGDGRARERVSRRNSRQTRRVRICGCARAEHRTLKRRNTHTHTHTRTHIQGWEKNPKWNFDVEARRGPATRSIHAGRGARWGIFADPAWVSTNSGGDTRPVSSCSKSSAKSPASLRRQERSILCPRPWGERNGRPNHIMLSTVYTIHPVFPTQSRENHTRNQESLICPRSQDTGTIAYSSSQAGRSES